MHPKHTSHRTERLMNGILCYASASISHVLEGVETRPVAKSRSLTHTFAGFMCLAGKVKTSAVVLIVAIPRFLTLYIFILAMSFSSVFFSASLEVDVRKRRQIGIRGIECGLF
ncbi:hypothetical protein CEXT_41831 [Caerostris extrusa]|uniref:Uncharacterized protein n=1 Tax=Caerostris extrusa TaxID=172846 RepID=A0AAV4T479_CAEEX|nr:hypothetical protein CEXT_41831 [Caerostris extrusa]